MNLRQTLDLWFANIRTADNKRVGFWRPIMRRVIHKFLDCGTFVMA